jgi:hypothetical protein
MVEMPEKRPVWKMADWVLPPFDSVNEKSQDNKEKTGF